MTDSLEILRAITWLWQHCDSKLAVISFRTAMHMCLLLSQACSYGDRPLSIIITINLICLSLRAPSGRGGMWVSTFTQVLYLSTNSRCLYFTWAFPFCVIYYFYSATSQREILYFLLHLSDSFFTLQITVFHPLPVQWKPPISRCAEFECLQDEMFLYVLGKFFSFLS